MNDDKISPTVLVVDDDEGLARLIEKTVRREGFNTAVAHSGAEALSWLAANKVDLMLLDLKLQDLTGVELVEVLSSTQCSVPFVIITGQGDERVAVDMMKRGALDYVVKDRQFLEFLPSVVHRALTRLDMDHRLAAAEAALQAEHAFSSAVLQTSGAIMIVVDTEGTIIRTNKAFEAASGYKEEEVNGKSFWEALLPCDAWEKWQARLATITGDSHAIESEGLLLTKGGQLRHIAWNITTLNNQAGGADYIIASGLDVTERRHLEMEVLEISGREQQRIGQDLHDGLCQVLAGIEVLTEVLRKRMANSSASDASALSTISGYLKEAIRQARMLARGLSPVEIDAHGLMSALQELAETTRELFKVRCDFECPQPVLIEDNAKATHLYRISQEAISNAIKHGRSKHIIISLASEGDTTRLEIVDDGSGFSSNSNSSNGMGLRTMRYRASTIGADLKIAPGPGKGTSVVCTLPTGH